jgi:hypothetical protein
MTNSWSLLFDELNMTNQDYWEQDGFSIVGNSGAASPDIINFGAAQSFDYLSLGGDDTISLNASEPSDSLTTKSKKKYDEDSILKELSDYISGTYQQHYSAGSDRIQTLDLIEACGDGEAFCRSNILKYASRYDKKGTARRDILKILHYAVLLMHFNDKNAQRETYPQ